MRLTIATLVACALVLAACTASAPADETGTRDTAAVAQAAPAQAVRTDQSSAVGAGLTVSGAGEATGTPDVVRVTVGVEVERAEVQQALDDANAATRRVLDALDAADIPAEDRQTQEFSVRPAYGQGPNGGEQVRGYTVTNLVAITVRGVDRVGQVLQAVTEAGGDAARIQDVRFDLEDDGPQLRAARQAAFEDARATAEHYAELAGRSLGALIGIEDVGMASPRSASADMLTAEAAGEAVPIEQGEQQVFVRIVARWALD